MSLLSGLVAFWSLNEASGVRYSHNSLNDLSDNNTVTTNPGVVGMAAQFVAANSEYLSHADNADLSTGDIDFTLAGWVYIDAIGAATYPRWIAKSNAAQTAGNIEYQVFFGDGDDDKLRFIIYDASANNVGDVRWGTASSATTWYYVVVWHDSVNNQVGISINNGTPVTSATSGGLS